jgi:hypothetical protein
MRGLGRKGKEQRLVGGKMVNTAAKKPGSFAAARRLSSPRPERAKNRSSRAGSSAKKPKTSIAMDSAASLVS